MLNKELSLFSESKSGNQISEYICNTFLGKFSTSKLCSLGYWEVFLKKKYFASDKDQEVDLEHSGSETHLDQPDGGGKVMSTIRGVGNKSLTHTNSLNTISSKQVPKYGVVTSSPEQEEELGQCLDNIRVWGIDVFQITELSNNRPLTAVTFQVFQERDLLSFFKIPATNLVSLLLTLEDHYLKVSNNVNNNSTPVIE